MRGQHRAQFGAETHGAVIDTKIDELDARRVTGNHQALASIIPDGETEHPVESIQYLGAPLFIAVNDDLGIRARAKDVSERLELASKLVEIVDLTVENDPDRFLLIRHRLMSACNIDNRKAAKSEPNRAIYVVALVVRTTVRD